MSDRQHEQVLEIHKTFMDFKCLNNVVIPEGTYIHVLWDYYGRECGGWTITTPSIPNTNVHIGQVQHFATLQT